MQTLTSKRWIHRRRARGVAMVEAGILAPIFAMMMMMTTYLGGVYEAKYRSFMKERYYTWSFSSSGCTNSPPNASTDGNATQEQDTGNDPCNKAQGESQAKAKMGIAHAYDEEVWSYQPTLRFNGGQPKKVHTDGYVVCNEKKVPAGIGSIFDQLGNLASQAAGTAWGGGNNCP
jgi:hypothetical protein